MAEIRTTRRIGTKTDDNGLITVPIDVCSPDGSSLNRRSFHVSTGALTCTMRSADLQAIGYNTSAPIVLPLIRIGAYDMLKISVDIGEANIIGANILKWFDFSISNTEQYFEVDLMPRLKGIVEKGINPNIKSAYLSKLKGSEYNENYDWYTWEQLDSMFPDSWILLACGNSELDYGGEVLWQSQTEVPDTSQKDTFLYCNKSVAQQKPFMVQYEDSVRCRGFSKPDAAFYGHVEELEARLKPPVIDRFYFDIVSRQGKLFRMSKSSGVEQDSSGAILTQAAIDALFEQMFSEEAAQES